jgi:dTDP-4-dehydrorhamnose reductase
MRLLLTGGTGQFGRALLEVATAHAVVAPGREALAVEDAASCAAAVEREHPDWVVHAAAMTDVDGCERDPARAQVVNGDAPGHLAAAAARTGCRLLVVSTDYVFDGTKGHYVETDLPQPLSVYGRTKLDGERQASSALPSVTIARTSVVFGPHKNNFVQWVRRSLRDGKPVRAAHDQWVTPTCTRDLALQVLALVEAGAQGVYHTAGAERLSRVEMALRIAAHDGLDAALVDPVPMESLPWVARRPRDASLDTSKIARLRRPMAFDEALDTLGPLEATA